MERSQPGQVIGYTSSKNLERVVSREFSNIHHQVQAVAYFAWTRKIDCPFHASLAPNLTYKRSIPKMKQPHDLASKESNKRLCHNPIFWWFGLWCTPLSKIQCKAGRFHVVTHMACLCQFVHGIIGVFSFLRRLQKSDTDFKQPNPRPNLVIICKKIFSPDMENDESLWRSLSISIC
jgi:hypothetical protein